jgi:hypothetical protein
VFFDNAQIPDRADHRLVSGEFKAVARRIAPSVRHAEASPAGPGALTRHCRGSQDAGLMADPPRLTENPEHLRHLRRYAVIARLLDAQFRVPLTRWRFGLDGLLGLVPGAGDIATAIVGAYGLIVAYKLGAPASIHARMVLNLLLDAGVGSIPIAGDLFDFAFKANIRNQRLLTTWLEESARKR